MASIDQQLIDGRYTVIERLGKGAMGVVYKAHDAVLDRQVAVKAMVAEIDDDPQLRQRFSQEARAAARLNHRNIITIYELHESENQLYIVMELLEGVDLATLMKRQVGLPLEAKLNMIAQVCDGLDYAHRKGIIHRDIKPANLHVSPAGTVKILDFGIARLAQSKMTTTGGLVGTPDYMSPEQVMAGNIDARSDLFAVGAVMYELLSGAKPFEADSVTALLMKIVRDPHVPLRDRAPHLPDAAILLVERLLQKDPNHRPSTSQEVQSALLAIATDRPPLDAATVSILATAVSAEAMRPKAPSPPTRTGGSGTVRKASGASSVVRPASDSSSRLASLAIERGRALREAGDLAGAMKVFRSVLEIAPGNAEALGELEEMERAFARITGSGRNVAVTPPEPLPQETPQAPPQPPPQYATPTIVKPGRDVSPQPAAVPPPPPPAPSPSPVLPPPAPTAGRRPPPVAPVAKKPRPASQGIALLAVAAIALMLLGAGAVYMILNSWGKKADDSAAQTSVASTSVPEQAALTTSSVAPPPEVAVAPETSTSVPPVTTVVPPSSTSSIVASAPPSTRPVTSVRPSTSVVTSAPTTAPVVTAPPPPSSVAPSSVPPPEPVAPAGPPSVMVRHNHARALFRGGGYCEGPLQLLPDGLYYKTSASSDGRQDEKKILFASVEDFEIDGDKIHIETDDKNWDFVAPKDVLQRIEALLKANKKK